MLYEVITDIMSESMEAILKRTVLYRTKELTIEEMVDFSRLICRLIDFKSKFTATHSSGVAAVAIELSRLSGFSKHERRLIEIAAYLHDLGNVITSYSIHYTKLYDSVIHSLGPVGLSDNAF